MHSQCIILLPFMSTSMQRYRCVYFVSLSGFIVSHSRPHDSLFLIRSPLSIEATIARRGGIHGVSHPSILPFLHSLPPVLHFFHFPCRSFLRRKVTRSMRR